MRICLLVLAAALLLTGCGREETWETVADEILQPASLEALSPVFTLPQDAAVTTMESETGGTIYFCDGYTVTVRTLPATDLNRTILETTGFSSDALTLVRTGEDGYHRIQCVWSAAGEEGEQVGRLTVLDDGANHHVLSCMCPAAEAPALSDTVQQLMNSFRLVSAEAISTGS